MSTLYEILGLEQSSDSIDPVYLRKSYHKALLRHHPDKKKETDSNAGICAPSGNGKQIEVNQAPTIDEIHWAYACLADPKRKEEYDKELRADASYTQRGVEDCIHFRTGLESVDLDEMSYHDGKFSKSCRCGEDEGYILTENEMEKLENELDEVDKVQSDYRTLILGCCGCSLWLKVEWMVLDDI